MRPAMRIVGLVVPCLPVPYTLQHRVWHFIRKLRRELLEKGFAVQYMTDKDIIREVFWNIFTPEDVFAYSYAIFHSPTYRTRYAEFLKIDFPRLPLTSDKVLFKKLVVLGQRLVDLHLMKCDMQWLTTYPVGGNNVVNPGFPKYSEGRVNINSTQYFEGIPQDVWEFHVGGYQVLDKWLRDRRGRMLPAEDIQHYHGIVASLFETIVVMNLIDETIPGFPLP